MTQNGKKSGKNDYAFFQFCWNDSLVYILQKKLDPKLFKVLEKGQKLVEKRSKMCLKHGEIWSKLNSILITKPTKTLYLVKIC